MGLIIAIVSLLAMASAVNTAVSAGKNAQYEADYTAALALAEGVTEAAQKRILDQISKNLPDFLWLESMSVSNNNIVLNGKATSYNAASNFYNNLRDSGYFGTVTLGRVFEVQEGVAFGITCSFAGLNPPQAQPAVQTQN